MTLMKNQMKLILLFVIFLIGATAYAQEDQPQDSLYLVSYSTGPGWDQDKSPNEQKNFAAHSKHLSTLRKEGVIKMGARAGELGLIVFSAENLKKAEEIIKSDIAVKEGLFNTDIKKFNVFYPGCIEK